ncbi:MAG: OsmC family protein [Bacteroidota bacterium]|nr:OsmC family protein [Bacteroidota bacterium]
MTNSATIKNDFQVNDIIVATEGRQKKISVPGKGDGFGSSVNGGELLFLSLATCFCNDLYREAAKRKVAITSV